MLTIRTAADQVWSGAMAVTRPGQRGNHAALRIVGDRLVVAYRTGHSVEIRDFPLVWNPASTSDPSGGFGSVTGRGVQDGPDPLTPVRTPGSGNGKKGSGNGSDETDPTSMMGNTPRGDK